MFDSEAGHWGCRFVVSAHTCKKNKRVAASPFSKDRQRMPEKCHVLFQSLKQIFIIFSQLPLPSMYWFSIYALIVGLVVKMSLPSHSCGG